MTPFDKITVDILSNDDFAESFSFNGETYKCVQSGINADIAYTEYGLVDEENFTLLVLASLPINRNDKIIFRGKNYKVSHIEIDSAEAGKRLFLVALSKGI